MKGVQNCRHFNAKQIVRLDLSECNYRERYIERALPLIFAISLSRGIVSFLIKQNILFTGNTTAILPRCNVKLINRVER